MTSYPTGQYGMGAAPFLPIGTEIGGYRIESFVRRGGMALVYEAEDLSLERHVALKMLAPELCHDAEFRDRFLRESRFAASLDHPNIVPIYAAGEIDGFLYIAMRYVPGGDLGMLLAEHGPLKSDRALAILSPVADALDTAHAAGLVHRDVKPANILIASSAGRGSHEHVYLSDFGLTRRVTGMSRITGTGQFIGTTAYIAPEQIRGLQPSARTDVYAFGCVVHKTLTSVPPFVREDEAALLWAHVSEEPAPLSCHDAGLVAADPVLARALAKDPADRYESCEQFIRALSAALLTERHSVDAATAGSTRPSTGPTVEDQLHNRVLSRQPETTTTGTPPPKSLEPRPLDERDAGARSRSAHSTTQPAFPWRAGARPPSAVPVAAAPAPPDTGATQPSRPDSPTRSGVPPSELSSREVAASPDVLRPRRRTWPWFAAAFAAALIVGALVLHPWSGDRKPGIAARLSRSSLTPTRTATTPPAHPAKWDRIAALPIAVEGAGAASFNDELWVVGGNGKTPKGPLGSVQVFDPRTGRWTMGPPLPQPVGEAGVVSTGHSLVVLGGLSPNGTVLDTVYRLDNPNGTWIPAGHLPQARVSGAAAFDGTRLVYAGGLDGHQISHSQVFAMQGNAWQELGPLPAPRNNFVAASDGEGTVWFFGGSQSGGDRTRTIFRLQGDAVSSESPGLAFGVRTPAAVLWPGAGVCLIGGDGNTKGVVFCVHPPPNAGWVTPKVQIPRGGLAAAVVGDHVYVVGGYFGGSQDSAVAESIRVR